MPSHTVVMKSVTQERWIKELVKELVKEWVKEVEYHYKYYYYNYYYYYYVLLKYLNTKFEHQLIDVYMHFCTFYVR